MRPTPNRRRFLGASLALGGAAPLAAAAAAEAQTPAPSSPAPQTQTPLDRPPWLIAAETKPLPSPGDQTVAFPGSDFMVDLMRAAGIEFIALIPGSTFRGLQESIVNYGQGRPELIVCTHEEISAAICHGYAKAAGKPMACLVHSTVGLQHASMAIFNAWCDRAPMMVLSGNIADETKRRPGVEWMHTALDLGAMVRDYVKWDDQPVSLQHFGESFMRACSLAVTPPMEPVLIVADAELQENPVGEDAPRIPALMVAQPPVGDPASVDRLADMLLAARSPVILVDRAARTPAGFAALVELAELTNTPVVDQLSRLNFPTNHYMNQTYREGPLVRDADFVLGLELTDPWGSLFKMQDIVGRPSAPLTKPGCRTAMISAEYLYVKSNAQDFERYFAPDLAIAADAEATLPVLIEAVRRKLTPPLSAAIAARRPALETAFQEMRESALRQATLGWDASPVSTARLSQELWDKLRGENWAIVSPEPLTRWPHRLWDFTAHHQYIGGQGGFGIGYGAPASIGGALAHRGKGRLCVNVQSDGDLMMTPGVFWTLAHHQIPLLTVTQNNRAWHQETMHVERMALRRQRSPEGARVGTVITDPNIDYAMMARSMGVWAEGPIDQPDAVGPALARAIAVVKSGKPALVDVVSQPR